MHSLFASSLTALLNIRMFRRTSGKRSTAADSAINVRLRHFIFFRQGMAQYRHIFAMKTVENSVMHVALPNPQFVDAVTQDIGKWPAQLVTKLGQARNCGNATLVSAVVRFAKFLEPIEHWNIVLCLLIKNDLCLRHATD